MQNIFALLKLVAPLKKGYGSYIYGCLFHMSGTSFLADPRDSLFSMDLGKNFRRCKSGKILGRAIKETIDLPQVWSLEF